ncbi:major facilitator superfamily domain-containing protein [Fennellomyces sp. T-0311]|nr:major facilitator superfamily domain-containing protein [Fennellomyces sp. T-0311]
MFVERTLMSFDTGVIQDIYLKNNIFRGSDMTTQLTLVGSLLQALQCACVIISNLLYNRLGARKLTILGAIMTFLGLMVTGETTTAWQMCLSLSVCMGLGITFLSGVAVRVLPQWFEKKRSTAFGLQASSSPLAGFLLPFIIVPVYNRLGHQWIFRVLAFMSIGINILPIAFVKDQKSHKAAQKKAKNFDFSVLKDVNMLIWIAVGPLNFSARIITMTFLPSYGTYNGLTDTEVAALAAVAAGLNLVGRLATGVAADRVGNMNTYTISTFLTTLSVFLIWMFAYDFKSMIAFSVVFGVFSGSYTVLSAPIALNIVGLERFPSALNFTMLAHVLDVIIPVVTSNRASNHNTGDSDPYRLYKLIGGSTYALCTLLGILLKFRLNKKCIAKV